MANTYSVILIKFNNYYNRKIKFFNDLQSYPYDSTSYFEQNVNFKFNDGITTTLILGRENNPLTKCDYDYLLLLNQDNSINSRWYILEADYKLKSQYSLSLKRDTMADFFESVKSSKALIKKATINDANNPLIFNKEGIEFNQIKTKEILLKDETNTNWIVGYLAKDYAGSGDNDIISIDKDDVTPDLSDFEIKFINELDPTAGAYFDVFQSNNVWKYPINLRYHISSRYDYKVNMVMKENGELSGYDAQITFYGRNSIVTEASPPIAGPELLFNKNQELWNRIRNPLLNYLSDVMNIDFLTKSEEQNIKSLNGKLIKYNNKYYQLGIVQENYIDYDKIFTGLENELPLFSVMQQAIKNTYNAMLEDPNFSNTAFYENDYPAYGVEGNYKRVTISLSETTGPALRKIRIPALRQTLIDAPYNMFALKFSIENLALVTAMVEELGANIYDVQLLPYFPRRDLIGIDPTSLQTKDATPIYLNEEIVDYLYWCVNSSDNFSISVNDEIFTNKTNPIDVKIKNETELCRICSPNYNGVYEFSIAKNNGVDYFLVAFTYKPYNPFILVSPSFSGLYGTNFNDGRGLICNGDFSLAIINDQWKTYEINNKNYQNIFDTQIKTNDVNNAIDIVSQSITSSLGAIGTGVGAGMFLGRAGGAGVGALSAMGGIADIALGQAKYQNQRQASIDIYNYNLGNIKARPDTLTKISSYNINNKYFPFIEYYTSTDIEKEIFRSKLEWDGMTVMTIDTIENWLDSKFIRADIIRIDDLNEDSHIAADISNELSKGVYLE